MEARMKIPAASNSCSPRGKMLLERTQIKKGIQPILLKVIELGRFSKSRHPEVQHLPSNYAGSIDEKQRRQTSRQWGKWQRTS
jgi:hypothetical protein